MPTRALMAGISAVLVVAIAILINLVTAGWTWTLVGALVVAAVSWVSLEVWRSKQQDQQSQVDDPLAKSRELAHAVSAAVQWPDEEVRRIDRLREDERYWVAYLLNSGQWPVQNVLLSLYKSDEEQLEIKFSPLDPGRRQHYILRPPEDPFPVDQPAPAAWVEFTALGYRWRSTDGKLKLLRSPSRGR